MLLGSALKPRLCANKHIYCSWNNGNFGPIVRDPGDSIAPHMRKNTFDQEWVNSTSRVNCKRKWLIANYLAAKDDFKTGCASIRRSKQAKIDSKIDFSGKKKKNTRLIKTVFS